MLHKKVEEQTVKEEMEQGDIEAESAVDEVVGEIPAAAGRETAVADDVVPGLRRSTRKRTVDIVEDSADKDKEEGERNTKVRKVGRL